MAKGDAGAVQRQIDTQTGTAQGALNSLRNNIGQQGQQFNKLFTGAVGAPVGSTDLTGAYANMASTGGFSPEDISAMRQQATAPAQGAFEGARNQILRNAAAQGNAPNTAAALSRLGRQESGALGSLGTQATGNIAQLQQQGKLYGLSGLSNLANMFGNQALTSTGQDVQSQNLQNAIAQMAIQGQLGKAQVPGDFMQGVNNVFAPLTGIGKVAGAITGLNFGGGGSSGRVSPYDLGY